MKLQNIDKKLYRKRLNIVIVGFIVAFTLLALMFGQVLIHFFSTAPTINAVGEHTEVNNFHLNLIGVLLGLAVTSITLSQLRSKDFFYEIYYVWQLKQLHNRIYRKIAKIKALAQSGNIDAYIVLIFYYESLKQVYELDDNTLVISKVNKDVSELHESMHAANLSVTADQFSKALLISLESDL